MTFRLLTNTQIQRLIESCIVFLSEILVCFLSRRSPRFLFGHGLSVRLCNLTANTQLTSVSRCSRLQAFRCQSGVAKRFRSRKLALF